MKQALTIAATVMIGLGTYALAGSGEKKGEGGCCPAKGETTCPMAAKESGENAEKPAYPLDVCVVSGEKLGNHGDPYVLKHDDREVKLCCKGCLKTFKKNPAKYLKKLDDAAAAEGKADEGHKH